MRWRKEEHRLFYYNLLDIALGSLWWSLARLKPYKTMKKTSKEGVNLSQKWEGTDASGMFDGPEPIVCISRETWWRAPSNGAERITLLTHNTVTTVKICPPPNAFATQGPESHKFILVT